jgi:hypothetical protein
MDNSVIGLRAQDFHESLKLTGSFGPKDVHFKRTLLIGKAASLAMHLRGLLYVEDITQLEYAASSLGIGSLELPAVLRELEEVDFVSVVQAGEEIKRIDVRIPTFQSGYADLGSRWKQLRPTEIEQASVDTLDRLYQGPISEDKLSASLGLQSAGFSILKDVMSSGQLLSIQAVDGVRLVFSPLAVDGNPTAYLQWATRFPSDVQKTLELLKGQQGLPHNDPALQTHPALADAVMTGVFMPVAVDGSTGRQRFLFAPKGGLSAVERTIMDKARAIVACVRYGQKFAANRAIKYPRRIVETLRENKKFNKGHPDLFTQYGLLVDKLLGAPVDEGGGCWNFHVHDTDLHFPRKA